MSSTQKRGFRLPWTDDRALEEGAAAATPEPASTDPTTGPVREDVGKVARRPAGVTQETTTDAAPAATDVPESAAEAEMTESESATTDRIESAAGGSWPTSDRAGAPEHARDQDSPGARPQLRVAGEGEVPIRRRENPLVAGLIKAMREAALASRADTTSRLQSEAAARVEAIRAESTDDAATLRKQVDDDIAGVREWSKAEMARIRQETEQRIEARREEAIAESKRHLDGVERLVDQVQSTVASFEADMDRFFAELLAESDPARLATLAEQAPEPPDLSDAGQRATTTSEIGAEASGDAPTGAGLEAGAAAEAEAEATEGLDLSSAESWPAAVMAAARRSDGATDGADTNEAAGSRLLVSGLTSVAGISAFKGALGQVSGIRSVSVSSGERGVFIFTVHHDPEVDLGAAVLSLEGFAARINRTDDDGLAVVAHEPAA